MSENGSRDILVLAHVYICALAVVVALTLCLVSWSHASIPLRSSLEVRVGIERLRVCTTIQATSLLSG